MRVEIIEVTEASADGARVEVRSELGQFRARWDGAPPRVGDRPSVELGFDHHFTWGDDITLVESRPHAIGPAGDGVALVATIEQLDEGGFVGLRLGKNVVMLEAEGEPPPVGATVRLEAPAVTLFDTGN